MNISETCNAAADLIEVRGWTSGATGWRGNDGPLCIEGALMAATGLEGRPGNVSHCPAVDAVRDHLGVRGPLWVWNDVQALKFLTDNPHPLCSPEAHEWGMVKVVATLRAVAVIHEAREEAAVTA